MNSKHRRTLVKIFSEPAAADLRWADVESLLAALGAALREGRGSRVRVLLYDAEAVFHRPHPGPHMDKAAVKSLRISLEKAGIRNDDAQP